MVLILRMMLLLHQITSKPVSVMEVIMVQGENGSTGAGAVVTGILTCKLETTGDDEQFG